MVLIAEQTFSHPEYETHFQNYPLNFLYGKNMLLKVLVDGNHALWLLQQVMVKHYQPNSLLNIFVHKVKGNLHISNKGIIKSEILGS